MILQSLDRLEHSGHDAQDLSFLKLSFKKDSVYASGAMYMKFETISELHALWNLKSSILNI